MRVVFVQAGLGAGGAEKVVSILARQRAEAGDDVHVLAFSTPREGSYFAYPESVRIETPRSESRNPALRIPRRILWLRQRFRQLKPDLIASFLTKPNVLTLAASRGLKIPVIISERNNPTVQAAHPLWHPAGLLLARSAARLVMQTEQARANLPARLRKKAVVIPNPCVIPTGARKNSGDGSRLVAVGRLDRQKGFDLLLEAFAQVATKIDRATLTIFGEGAERAALQEQARKLGIAERVRLPGVTRSPGEWLDAGDIFVLSSRFEGFPNVLVEALAAGFAAVAFDCPWGPSSIVSHEKDGLLVPAEDVEALAQALQRVITEADLRHALAAAAPQAASRYELSNVLGQWTDVFAQAVSRR